jgi:hypothetical protein
MTTLFVRRAAPVVLGLLSGLGLAVAWSALNRSPPESALTRAGAPADLDSRLRALASGPAEARGAAHASRSGDARLTAIERQLAGVEAQLDSPTEPGAPHKEEPPAAEINLEERTKQELELWSSKLAEHAAEALDEPWSSETSRKFQTDLTRFSQAREFSVIQTDCRMTSCAATLRFRSYGEAVDELSGLLHADYEVGCARRITLPEPEDPDGPYDGTILFDCTDARAPM